MTTAKFGAGQMDQLVAFDKREPVDDGDGNTVSGAWREMFRQPAEFVYQRGRGSETVLAARLSNRAPMFVRVRVSSQTAAVNPDWRMRDVRRGTIYNIRDITNESSRAIFDMLVESGVADG